VAFQTFPGGPVVINGNNRPDTVIINDNGVNLTVMGTGPFLSSFGGFSAVTINTFGGNDTVTYRLNGSLQFGTSRQIVANLGVGADTFRFTALPNSFIGTFSTLSVNVHGGAGVNRISVGYQGVNQGRINVNAFGGGARDLIFANLNFNTNSFGSLSANLMGGGGADLVGLAVRKVSPFDLPGAFTRINGGVGFDTGVFTPGVNRTSIEEPFLIE
jgi:hypothetical protein